MAILLVFMALQFCDLATTLVFLGHGVAEGNPLMAALIRVSAHPALALLVVKLAACGAAAYAWRRVVREYWRGSGSLTVLRWHSSRSVPASWTRK